MSQCHRCAGGCHDFSSRAAQLPSLASIDVVHKIFTQAVANTARRAAELQSGMLSPAEIEAADEKLANWLGVTFTGGNRHYASGEGWNDEGLAHYLRETLSEAITEAAGGVPHNDQELVFAAIRVFMTDLYRIIDHVTGKGVDPTGIEASPAAQKLIGFWSSLMVGAPVEML